MLICKVFTPVLTANSNVAHGTSIFLEISLLTLLYVVFSLEKLSTKRQVLYCIKEILDNIFLGVV